MPAPYVKRHLEQIHRHKEPRRSADVGILRQAHRQEINRHNRTRQIADHRSKTSGNAG